MNKKIEESELIVGDAVILQTGYHANIIEINKEAGYIILDIPGILNYVKAAPKDIKRVRKDKKWYLVNYEN